MEGGPSYVQTTLSHSAYCAARLFLLGGVWKFAHEIRRQARRHADLPPAAGAGSFDLAPLPPHGNGRLRVYAESAFLVCRARSGTQCGDPGRGDCWALHSLGDPFVIALDDGYSQYLSGILGVESIGGAAFDCPCFVLAEATGEALGTCRAFIKNTVERGGGGAVVQPDAVPHRPGLKDRGNGENPSAVLTLPVHNSIVLVADATRCSELSAFFQGRGFVVRTCARLRFFSA